MARRTQQRCRHVVIHPGSVHQGSLLQNRLVYHGRHVEDGGLMIGSLSTVALECPDPAALAEFYRQVTGWEVVYADRDWHSLAERPDAPFLLSFQRSVDYQPPTWPDPRSSMQFHLHFKVADLDEAQSRVCSLGATVFENQPDPSTVRVMADPAGHIFCLCPQTTTATTA